MTIQHRGILRAYANADPNAVMAQLQTAFAGFKEKHQGEVADLRAAVDEMAAQSAMAGMRGNPTNPAGPGNHTHEIEALAQFSRFGEVRADLSIGGGEPGDLSKGGAAVFPAISNQIMVRQFAQSALARLARRVTITAGNVFEEPQDLGEPGAAWVDETEARPNLGTADFERLTIPVDEVYTSQRITQRLLDDSQYPLGGWLAERIADKLARAAGAAFMTGDANKKPKGLADYPMTSEADSARAWGTIQAHYTGTDGAFGAGGAGPDLLVDVVYSLAAQFRPNARWIMNSKTAGIIRKMKDGENRFIWSDSLAAGQPALLMGHPVELDEYAPDMATDAPAIFFGDFATGYCIVEKPGLRLLRDPFSNKPNVIFYAYSRIGGRLQDSEAVKAVVFGTEPE